ncbi:MAG: TetR/AcrR family transcriptional regulator [Novosphingobium sp.]|nr:TetR/AcrR family transcriptional regulator [Novosphingobium sp.]MCP5403689.1 TetR/AcrR family transcriptional regulator [Novosphingobium sp.]
MASGASDIQSPPASGRATRKRPDARREATRLAIIEAAETLFADQGVDAVSLRQIGAAIGARNTAVVAYHFGDKEALVEAILAHRLPKFEKRRAELITELEGREPDMADIMRALWLPLFEQRNAEGRRSYAAFLASLGRSQWGWVWSGSGLDVPVTLEIGRKVQDLMPPAARKHYWERVLAITALVSTSLETIDRREGDDPVAERALFEDAMRMAAAALCAPGA